MMILADGDIVQYQQLKKSSIVDFLVRLTTFVEQHEQVAEIKAKAKFQK